MRKLIIRLSGSPEGCYIEQIERLREVASFMMCFTSTTYAYAYAAASNPSSCRAPSRLIFAACGFGGFSWGDRSRAFLVCVIHGRIALTH